MKCPICNAENDEGATSCQRCGFGLALSQPVWPDTSAINFPDPISVLPPTAQPTFPSPAVISKAELVEFVDARFSGLGRHDESPRRVGVASPEPAEEGESDDRLAMVHIQRGYEALRQSLREQAEWEFEQARDLAEDAGIVQEAQEQLAQLRGLVDAVVQDVRDDQTALQHLHRGREALDERLFDQARWEFEQARRVAQGARVAQMAEAYLVQLRTMVDQEIEQRLNAARRAPAPAPVRPVTRRPTRWRAALRPVLFLGVVACLLTAGVNQPCLSFFAALGFGFLAGVLVVRQASGASMVDTGIGGALVGVGGWLGDVVTGFVWASPGADVESIFTTVMTSMCFAGPLLVTAAAFGGVMGGLVVKWNAKS